MARALTATGTRTPGSAEAATCRSIRLLESDPDTRCARHQAASGHGQILEHLALELCDPCAVWPHERPHQLVRDLGRSRVTSTTLCVSRDRDDRHLNPPSRRYGSTRHALNARRSDA